jgi:hypothetical protein
MNWLIYNVGSVSIIIVVFGPDFLRRMIDWRISILRRRVI